MKIEIKITTDEDRDEDRDKDSGATCDPLHGQFMGPMRAAVNLFGPR